MKRKGKPTIKERFGAAVRKRRHELGISQEKLAERSGLHRTYVADIERGIRNVSIENVEKLACALEISISALFAGYNVDS
ncbi:MAG TPA: helix-turn-helix transcriptional regulator [Blastocatellia bacterium]|nr:helix-turn-helix transcriptional regulator [Blastocatellia bacterium]